MADRIRGSAAVAPSQLTKRIRAPLVDEALREMIEQGLSDLHVLSEAWQAQRGRKPGIPQPVRPFKRS